jgi:hypothetical protein
MVRIVSSEIIDMQRCRCVVDEALEKLVKQVDVELADPWALELDPVLDAGPPGKIYYDTRQRLVQRHVSMPVTHNALLVPERLLEGLAQGNTDILHRMVIIDMQITAGVYFEVECTMTRDLLEHMFEERNPGIETGISAAIEVQDDIDLGFQRIAADICTSF